MFSDAKLDLEIMLLLIGLSFVVSAIMAIFIKRKIRAAIIFSVLANLIVFLVLLTGTRLFKYYNVVWLQYFPITIWPILNIFLVIKFWNKKIKD